jgi:N,N'-diacetyllegionaminate synthase
MKAKSIILGNRNIGQSFPPFIIAEIGANHNGSLETALSLIEACAQAGADAVKFQAYKREKLYARNLPSDARAAKENRLLLRERWNILPRFTTPASWWSRLKKQCHCAGVEFLCTPFDLENLALLDRLGIKAFKIASGDITYKELICAAARLHKPLIVSTGASNMQEVEHVLQWVQETDPECPVAIMHCIANYPPDWNSLNLMAISQMAYTFDCPTGFSDHTPGAAISVAATALGASIIEKHVTFDRRQHGLDHHFALTIDEFAHAVKSIQRAWQALGHPPKKSVPQEEIERYWIRRGLWALRAIRAGNAIEHGDIAALRPRHGLGAEYLEYVIGHKAAKDIEKGMPLTEDMIQ